MTHKSDSRIQLLFLEISSLEQIIMCSLCYNSYCCCSGEHCTIFVMALTPKLLTIHFAWSAYWRLHSFFVYSHTFVLCMSKTSLFFWQHVQLQCQQYFIQHVKQFQGSNSMLYASKVGILVLFYPWTPKSVFLARNIKSVIYMLDISNEMIIK